MKGRWICQQCGTVYHIPNVAPSEVGVVRRVRRAAIIQRHDETPEIQAKRYDVYEHDTLPLVDYYRQRGVLRRDRRRAGRRERHARHPGRHQGQEQKPSALSSQPCDADG